MGNARLSRFNDDIWIKIIRLYGEGMTISELAKRFHVSHEWIRVGLAKRSLGKRNA
jgi:transposase